MTSSVPAISEQQYNPVEGAEEPMLGNNDTANNTCPMGPVSLGSNDDLLLQ